MSVVADVQAYLEAQTLIGGATGWGSVRRLVHDQTDKLVVITEDGGPQSPIDAASGLGSGAVDQIGVQVLVRGEPRDSDAAQAKADAILEQLHSLKDESLNGTVYIAVRSRTPEPVFFGFDGNERPQFTTSFLAAVAAVA